MHLTPFQLWWRHIKTNITNNSGNYNITDLSLYKDRMMKDRFVNSYTTRGTSKECPRGRSAILVHALRGGNMWCRQWLSTAYFALFIPIIAPGQRVDVVIGYLSLFSLVVSNSYISQRSGPYWSNPPFFNFLTFGHSGAQSWAPECPNVKKLKRVG